MRHMNQSRGSSGTIPRRLGRTLVLGFVTAVIVGIPAPRPALADTADVQRVQITDRLHLSHPFGVAVDLPRGVMYVADSLNNRVLQIATSGTILGQWRGWKGVRFQQPGAVAVGRDGSVYVIDYGNNYIDRFAADGRPLQRWGSYGTSAGEFAGAEDLTIDERGNVYVADAVNFRVQKFSPTGRSLSAWTTITPPRRQLMAPMGVGVAPDGDVYVSEIAAANDMFGNPIEASDALHCIQRFSPDGLPLNRWGTRGSLPGQFIEPRGIAVGASGQVYVADFGNNRIEQFSGDGTFQRTLGPDTQPGLRLHGPVALAPDGGKGLYVADWFNSRIDRLSASGTIVGFWR